MILCPSHWLRIPSHTDSSKSSREQKTANPLPSGFGIGLPGPSSTLGSSRREQKTRKTLPSGFGVGTSTGLGLHWTRQRPGKREGLISVREGITKIRLMEVSRIFEFIEYAVVPGWKVILEGWLSL